MADDPGANARADEASVESDTPLPTHSEDGVDLTLIRWMLSLTPAQRLETLQSYVLSVLSMRHGRYPTQLP